MFQSCFSWGIFILLFYKNGQNMSLQNDDGGFDSLSVPRDFSVLSGVKPRAPKAFPATMWTDDQIPRRAVKSKLRKFRCQQAVSRHSGAWALITESGCAASLQGAPRTCPAVIGSHTVAPLFSQRDSNVLASLRPWESAAMTAQPHL